MSLEQIILLVVFAGIPIYRALRRRMREVSAAEVARTPVSREAVGDRHQAQGTGLAPAEVEPSARGEPPALAKSDRPRDESVARRQLATAVAPIVERPVSRSSKTHASAGTQATRGAISLVRGGPDDLRRALVVMAILGPPRALDPP